MSVTDGFEFWRRRLAGEIPPIDVNDPQNGYYKLGRKDKQTGDVRFSTVAYWRDKDSGALQCRIDGEVVDENRAIELWPYASKRPISYETYGAVRRGEPWPGENAAVIGHNAAPVEDDIAAITERIEDLAREAERLIAAGAAKTDGTSDQASDLANTFSELAAKITGLHKKEKEPHLEAGRLVDRKWFGLRDRAEDLKKRLKAIVVTPFLVVKKAEAEKAAAAAVAAGTPVTEVAKPRVTAGSSKRSTGLRTFKSAKVTDWDALITHLKAHPEVRETVQRIADASAKADIVLPGMEIVKEQKAA